ncbi:MAG: T9SS type A sorting domain-containing protein [Bacteroidota bacterium]|nr:T9SS type A sorting domain-containing protein [Bacteroidota bacterium]
MKKLFFHLLLSFSFVSTCISFAQAQVNVTFVLNTATISDTVRNTSTVTVSGSNAELTNWGAGIAMNNIGGDYWSKKISFNSGDTLVFEFRANGGWEYTINNPYGIDSLAYGGRVFIVGKQDTVLPLQFYNSSGITQAQYWRPYPEPGNDTLTVWVRVNMEGVMQNYTFGWTSADTDSVAIVGDSLNGAASDLDWKISHYLKKERNHYFFSGPIHFAKSKINFGDSITYHFRLGNLDRRSELQGKLNRKFQIPLNKIDTTLAYVYFDNVEGGRCRCGSDTCIVTFRVNMKRAIDDFGFSQGDTIVVQTGFFKTAAEVGRQKQINHIVGTLYQVTDTVMAAVGKTLDYQYYLLKNGSLAREMYLNTNYFGTNNAEAIVRQTYVTSKKFTVLDTSYSVIVPHYQPTFPGQVPLKSPVTVKWVVDMHPAYACIRDGATLRDVQGKVNVSVGDSIKSWGVAMNGPATNLPKVYPIGDWADWDKSLVADTSKRKMWDDGTHGDLKANDSLYTVEYTYPIGSINGKIFRFSIGGGNNENGEGKEYDYNHVKNFPDANPTITIYSQWGTINPLYYSFGNWIVDTILDVRKFNDGFPTNVLLTQNYPNPFNPSTTINYQLPVNGFVTLKIYDVLGREIATLVNEQISPGNHSAVWNASSFSSGVYFYRLTAGNYTNIKRMILVK